MSQTLEEILQMCHAINGIYEFDESNFSIKTLMKKNWYIEVLKVNFPYMAQKLQKILKIKSDQTAIDRMLGLLIDEGLIEKDFQQIKGKDVVSGDIDTISYVVQFIHALVAQTLQEEEAGYDEEGLQSQGPGNQYVSPLNPTFSGANSIQQGVSQNMSSPSKKPSKDSHLKSASKKKKEEINDHEESDRECHSVLGIDHQFEQDDEDDQMESMEQENTQFKNVFPQNAAKEPALTGYGKNEGGSSQSKGYATFVGTSGVNGIGGQQLRSYVVGGKAEQPVSYGVSGTGGQSSGIVLSGSGAAMPSSSYGQYSISGANGGVYQVSSSLGSAIGGPSSNNGKSGATYMSAAGTGVVQPQNYGASGKGGPSPGYVTGNYVVGGSGARDANYGSSKPGNGNVINLGVGEQAANAYKQQMAEQAAKDYAATLYGKGGLTGYTSGSGNGGKTYGSVQPPKNSEEEEFNEGGYLNQKLNKYRSVDNIPTKKSGKKKTAKKTSQGARSSQKQLMCHPTIKKQYRKAMNQDAVQLTKEVKKKIATETKKLKEKQRQNKGRTKQNDITQEEMRRKELQLNYHAKQAQRSKNVQKLTKQKVNRLKEKSQENLMRLLKWREENIKKQKQEFEEQMQKRIHSKKEEYIKTINKFILDLQKKKNIEEQKLFKQKLVRQNQEAAKKMTAIEQEYRDRISLLRQKRGKKRNDEKLMHTGHKQIVKQIQKELKRENQKQMLDLAMKYRKDQAYIDNDLQELKEKIVEVYKKN